MRDISLEASIWNLFTSHEFFEAAARECEGTMAWFGTLAVNRGAVDFGRNNQIFDYFKRRAEDFRRAASLAKLDDYQMIWDISKSIRGDTRGMIEQPLHSWMTENEYLEFDSDRLTELLRYAANIERAINNAMIGADSFFHPNTRCPERSNDDDGFPGERIIKSYDSYLQYSKRPLICKIPDPILEYVVNKYTSCGTGDEVPWSGVWYPATGLEHHSLTFAIKGMRMQPAYKVIKTTEELRTAIQMFPPPETVAIATTWHPVIVAPPKAETSTELWSKAGQQCPREGIWEPTDPGAARRYYRVGDVMLSLKSAYGYTVWRWVSER